MVDAKGPSHLLLVFAQKFEEFVWEVENKHLIWLQEIEEEAKRMFSSDFSAEPELMPKTPSQKKRRKKNVSTPDEDQELTGKRVLRKRRSSNWVASVRRLSVKLQKKEAENSIIDEEAQPKRVTRARAQAQMTSPVAESTHQDPSIVPVNGCIPVIDITASDQKSAESHIPGTDDKIEEVIVVNSDEESPKKVETMKPMYTEGTTVAVPETPEVKERDVSKVKLAQTSTPKQVEMEVTEEEMYYSSTVCQVASKGPEIEQMLDLTYQKGTPTGSKSDRRSVRRSLVGRPSKSRRISLVEQYSLANKRDSMTREAVRKSIRRSISKKRAAMESSASGYVSCQSSVEMVDDGDISKVRHETIDNTAEDEVSKSPRRSLRLRNAKKIAISNLAIEPEQGRVTRQTVAQVEKQEKEKEEPEEQTHTARRRSYKRAMDEQYDGSDEQPDNDEGPPSKKSPSPPCPANKVVRPPPHMRGFLHTVQKNQLLMMTPSSIGRNIVVKSFIKRNTPLKVDPKRQSSVDEKERQRQENLRKKQEAELVRKQKMEEEKKRKLDELKLRREERLRKVLQARERVEQMEEEKKKKIEQKFAQIDEKNEKVREDRIAKEKAKKKVTAKIVEDMELRRRQEEEARKQKLQQMEEEEWKHQEMIQKKKDEEEQERIRKVAEAKKQAEQELQREQQLAAERKKEQVQAQRERERQEKEKTMQLQRELERAAHERAVAREKERLQKEMEERRKKEQLERQQQRERQEKLQEERRLQEEQEKRAKEKQLTVGKMLNVTVKVENSPAPTESYQMTPQGQKPKPPKICDEDYGMDLNSDDSTDDESQPRKPIPSWATGMLLNQAIRHQYYNPVDTDSRFGRIDSPKLEDMFNKSKPRYFKRTSSAVWHSPPLTSNRINLPIPCGLKKY
ncbi:inner centromere protein isoform X1 [Microcaecilia unicolor]|uniref:Inner centromere protein isoform X1 n=1 Tax=Microcaecilia unicolor TaxID=1415580 RepID=A0A6P7Y1Y7_9AMPH|nr:inner centromere protein isoform X1 [Microcaecilia unicolor]XP_030057050.1 inner centromere protein isoform X1 [Microcaecilia unicolor]